ncbi:hypothetical protein ACRU3B_18170 [Mycobacterium colombiense]
MTVLPDLPDFETRWDDLTYRLIEAVIDDDSYRVMELVEEASKHPDLHAVLINLAALAVDQAIVRTDRTRTNRLTNPGDLDRDQSYAAKHWVQLLLRLRGAE